MATPVLGPVGLGQVWLNVACTLSHSSAGATNVCSCTVGGVYGVDWLYKSSMSYKAGGVRGATFIRKVKGGSFNYQPEC